MVEQPNSTPARSSVLMLGVGLVLLCALVRATAVFDPFPYWGSDPFQMDTPTTGITPALSVLIDVATVLGAALVFAAMTRRNQGPRWWEIVCLAAGTAAAGWHALAADGGSIDNIVTGGVWVSAMTGGLAIRTAAADRRARAVMVATMLGSVAVFAGKGLLQVLIEHPQTVRAYRENREAFLSAQGWSEGSSMARAFERRLLQPEASDWFGLSNVYASVMAGCSVALAGLLTMVWRITRSERKGSPRNARHADSPQDRTRLILLGAGALAGGVGLVLARSKGGIGAALIGGALVVAAMFAAAFLDRRLKAPTPDSSAPPSRPRSYLALLGPALCALMLAAVVARGLVGERLGELSLLFRWFYMEGAARIFAAHPLLGVGPADFKEAYLLAKPPLSPEEVTSPHSVLLDYAATLGIAGLAWGGLWLSWVARAGSVLLLAEAGPRTDTDDGPDAAREDGRVLLTVAGLATVLGAYLEAPAVTIDSMLVRLAAMGLWVGIGAAILSAARRAAMHRAITAAMSCGALTLAVHGQIEVTPVWPGAAAWFMVMIALAAGAPSCRHLHQEQATTPEPAMTSKNTGRRSPGATTGLAMVALALVILAVEAWAGLGVRRWEQMLKSTATSALDLAAMRAELAEAQTGAAPGRAPGQPANARHVLSTELTRRLGKPVSENPDALRLALREHELQVLEGMLKEMRGAIDTTPPHFQTVRSASRVALERFAAAGDLGPSGEPQARASAQEAEEVVSQFLNVHLNHAGAWGWLGTLRSGLGRTDRDERWPRGAAAAWEHAEKLDPYSLQYAPDLARLYAAMGDQAQARAWADRALQVNDLHRLDPLAQLRETEVAEMKRISAGS